MNPVLKRSLLEVTPANVILQVAGFSSCLTLRFDRCVETVRYLLSEKKWSTTCFTNESRCEATP